MSENHVLLSIDNNIAIITLNRPEVRNAFDDQTIKQLTNHLVAINNDNTVQVVVLQGQGPHFSAGADLKWMQRMIDYSASENANDAMQLANMLRMLDSLKVPTIASIQGYVFGGALGLIACCDIAIAANNATFCLSEVKLGLSPAVISPYIINAIGAKTARRLMLTAESFDAKTAHCLGLTHKVVDPSELIETVNSYTKMIKSNGKNAMQATKELISFVKQEQDPKKQDQYTSKLIAKLRASDEAQQRLKKFLEK